MACGSVYQLVSPEIGVSSPAIGIFRVRLEFRRVAVLFQDGSIGAPCLGTGLVELRRCACDDCLLDGGPLVASARRV